MADFPPQGTPRQPNIGPEFVSTNYGSGLSDDEIWRTELTSAQSVEVERLELQATGGSSISAASFDVYDSAASAVVASVSAGSATTGTPIGSTQTGATVLGRLTTPSGASAIMSLNTDLKIV
jgi:hypothetical protein